MYFYFSLFVFPEPALWKPAEKVQEQQRLAKTLGGVHQLQPLLLQVTPGERCRQDMGMSFGRSLTTEGSLPAHRMTIPWPASLCSATLSPFRPSRRTSTKITSSNSTSNRTCTTSDQRASTPLRGGRLKK